MNTRRDPKIEIINTGSELLLGYVLNTHQQWLCRQLSERGYRVARQVAVSDSGPAIQEALREALTRADLIIVTGGLGPTSDDQTRELVAELLGVPLVEQPDLVQRIESFFQRRNRPIPARTRVQALVPQGGEVLVNQHGTAPGLVLRHGESVIAMLPGPPRELRPMFVEQLVPIIHREFGLPEGYCCAVLRSTGIGESFVEEKIAPVLDPLLRQGLQIGYCARVGEVDVRLVAYGPQAAQVVAAAEAEVHRQLRGFIYGRDPEQLDAVVVRLLTEQRQTLAVAESCTGGYIANRITNISGASAVFLAGLVTYSNEAKQQFLGVREETLRLHGAVSEPTAREMAEGARARAGADFAVAVTGIAGPSGGTAEKPVGTVFIALASAAETLVKKFTNQYDRETFKYLTSQQALDWLRRKLLSTTE